MNSIWATQDGVWSVAHILPTSELEEKKSLAEVPNLFSVRFKFQLSLSRKYTHMYVYM